MTLADYIAAFARRFAEHRDREERKRAETEAAQERVAVANAGYIGRLMPRFDNE